MRAVLAALALVAAPVQAAAVYEWSTTGLPDALASFGGRITFIDAAVPVALTVTPGGPIADSPIARIEFFLTDAQGESSSDTTEFAGVTDARFRAFLGLAPGGDGLAGSLLMNTPGIDFDGFGTASSWTIGTFVSDDRGTLCSPTAERPDADCGGITGFWSVANDVPLPGPLALMAAAGLGMIVTRRRPSPAAA